MLDNFLVSVFRIIPNFPSVTTGFPFCCCYFFSTSWAYGLKHTWYYIKTLKFILICEQTVPVLESVTFQFTSFWKNPSCPWLPPGFIKIITRYFRLILFLNSNLEPAIFSRRVLLGEIFRNHSLDTRSAHCCWVGYCF